MLYLCLAMHTTGRYLPVCGARRIVPKAWMGKDHPSPPVLGTFVIGGRYIRSENNLFVHSRSPVHVLEIVDSQMVAPFDWRAFRLARESGETLYHVAPIENHRGKEGSIKTWIALLLNCRVSDVSLTLIGLSRSQGHHVPSSSQSCTHVAGPAPPHRIFPRRSACLSVYWAISAKLSLIQRRKKLDQLDRWCTTGKADDLTARKAVCATTFLDPPYTRIRNHQRMISLFQRFFGLYQRSSR